MTREEYKEFRENQKKFSDACRETEDALKYHAEETDSKVGKALYTTGRVITGILKFFLGGGQ